MQGSPESGPDAADAPVREPFSLALGGGGARGLAHIGVLEVLEPAGLRPAVIAGTSIGAVIGALYAAGHGAAELARIADSLELRQVFGAAMLNLSPSSILSADPLEKRLREVLPPTFEELGIPLACVAADLVSGERVVLTEGDLPRAVRASMSIPIVFDPVEWPGRWLVDGGVVDPVPVEAARALGGDPVVAVDVGALVPGGAPADEAGHNPSIDPGRTPSLVQVGTRSFDVMQHRLAMATLEQAAVVVAPDVGRYLMADFLEHEAIMEAGRVAARIAVPAIEAVCAPEGPATSPRPRSRTWFERLFGPPEGH